MVDINVAEQMRNAKTAKRSGAEQQPKNSSNLAAKTPALEQLASQIAARGDAMESDARAIVQQSMLVVRDRVRQAVTEELEAVADDDDFFGFTGMFDDTPEASLSLENETKILDVEASSVTL